MKIRRGLDKFVNFGTGATSRTLRDRLRDTKSAFDFMTGAQIADVRAGTLLQDVTAALQAAKTACVTNGWILDMPAGNYLISDTAFTISHNDHFQVHGIPFKTKITNKAGSNKPTILVDGGWNWWIVGLSLLGALGFPNKGIRLQADGSANRACFGHIDDVICNTNGIGIHVSDSNSVWVRNYHYWFNGGSFLGGAADGNNHTNAILADGSTPVNDWHIRQPHIGHLPNVAAGGTGAIRWATSSRSNNIHIDGGEIEQQSVTTERSFYFENVDHASIAHMYLDNSHAILLDCTYVDVGESQSGATFSMRVGDGTAPNACSHVTIHGINGDTFTEDAFCAFINHYDCTWQTFTKLATNSFRISHATPANVADELGYAGIKERARTAAMGEWITPAFDAADFQGDGTVTWTVQSGDVITFKYMLVGKTMTVAFLIATSSTGGTASNTIAIKIPGGFLSAGRVFNTFKYSDAGGAEAIGVIDTGPATNNLIGLLKLGLANWSNISVNNLSVAGEITFEVQ